MPPTSARRSSVIASALALIALLLAGCDGESDGGDVPADSSIQAQDAKPGRRAPLPPRAPAPPDGGGGQLSPLDVGDPQIGNLDQDLLEAVQEAWQEATADGVEFWVNSGWRSREEQQRLLDEAVAKYGSLEEALRLVATPDTSAHVSGEAVDIGPTDADSWLMQHGADYGLCQTFANEMWHFELSVDPGDDCPQPLPDGTFR
jgi:D-alanyl-D-alanine carboxypeptidase